MNEQKTLKKQATEGFVITLVGDSLYKVLGILTTVVVLAVLTPYEYGLWRLLQSVLSFMGIVALTGIAGVVVADIARELGRGQKSRAYAATWRVIMILVTASMAAAFSLVAIAPIVSVVSKIHLTLYLWILAVSLLFGGVTQVLQILFQARLEPRRALVLKNVANLSYLIAIVLCIPYLHLSVLGLVIAYTISTVIPIFIFLPYIIHELRVIAREREQNSYSLREVLIRRGGWALASDYVSILESSAWPWVVGYFLSIEQVAYAGLALVIVSQVYSLVPIQYVLRGILPRLMDNRKHLDEWIGRASRYSIWFHGLAALVVFSGFTAASLWFFPHYAIVIPLVTTLLIAAPFRAVSAIVVEWMYAMRNQRELFLSTSLPRIFWLVLLPFLVMHMGMTGFAIWYLGSSLSIIFARFFVSRKELSLPRKWQDYFFPDAVDWIYIKRSIVQGVRMVFERRRKTYRTLP